MAIRMIVSDLDGTLLDAAYRLSEETKAAIREAAGEGVRVLLATGRMFTSAVRYAQELALDTPVISHNGGVVQEMPVVIVVLFPSMEIRQSTEVVPSTRTLLRLV